MIQLYMLDTNMISYIVKGRSTLARGRLAELSLEQTACISAITEGELLYGLAKSGSTASRRSSLELLLSRVKVQPWGRDAAASYGSLRAKQEAIGKTLSSLDMQIAAHAVALGAVLVSNDRAFQHVPDLAGLQNWATDLASA